MGAVEFALGAEGGVAAHVEVGIDCRLPVVEVGGFWFGLVWSRLALCLGLCL